MATIKDVARYAGVSTATVSRAFNNPEALTHDTLQKVTEAVRALQYRRDRRAAAIRTGQTGVVGLVVGDITDPHFARLAWHVEHAVRRRGWSLQIGNTDDDPTQQARLIRMLAENRVDGLIVVPPTQPLAEASVPTNTFLPTVLVDRTVPGVDAPTVVVDTAQAIDDLARHLYEVGYRRPAILAGPSTTSTGRARREQTRTSLLRFGYLDMHIGESSFRRDEAMNVALEILVDYSPDVMICAGNLIAEGALAALHEAGLMPGRDVGIASIDDAPWFSVTWPAITAIHQPLGAVARSAVAVLDECITTAAKGLPGPHGQIEAGKGQLLVRQSTPGPDISYGPTIVPE